MRHQVIRLRRSAPMEMARDGRSGVRGHPPTRVFVKQNNIWLLHKPQKPTPPWRLSRKPDPTHSPEGRFIDRAKVA